MDDWNNLPIKDSLFEELLIFEECIIPYKPVIDLPKNAKEGIREFELPFNDSSFINFQLKLKRPKILIIGNKEPLRRYAPVIPNLDSCINIADNKTHRVVFNLQKLELCSLEKERLKQQCDYEAKSLESQVAIDKRTHVRFDHESPSLVFSKEQLRTVNSIPFISVQLKRRHKLTFPIEMPNKIFVKEKLKDQILKVNINLNLAQNQFLLSRLPIEYEVIDCYNEYPLLQVNGKYVSIYQENDLICDCQVSSHIVIFIKDKILSKALIEKLFELKGRFVLIQEVKEFIASIS